jgi:hypothetical protein
MDGFIVKHYKSIIIIHLCKIQFGKSNGNFFIALAYEKTFTFFPFC